VSAKRKPGKPVVDGGLQRRRGACSTDLAQVHGGAVAELPGEVAKLESTVAVGSRLCAREDLVSWWLVEGQCKPVLWGERREQA
jgi:hypothetical protein